jgi:hypothetical protein
MSIFSIKIEGSVDVNHHLVGATFTNTQFTELTQLLINNQGILMDVATKLAALAAREEAMADDVRTAIDELTQQVSAIEDQGDSLITAFQGLAAQMEANAGNAQAIRDLAQRTRQQAREMADAVLTPGTGGGAGGTGGAGGAGGATTEPGVGGGGTPSGGGTEPPPAGGTEPGAGEPPPARRR